MFVKFGCPGVILEVILVILAVRAIIWTPREPKVPKMSVASRCLGVQIPKKSNPVESLEAFWDHFGQLFLNGHAF